MNGVSITLGEIAEQLNLVLDGDRDLEITGVQTLAAAGAAEVAFLANSAYRRELSGTAAAAVVLAAEDSASCPVATLISRNPYADFARIAAIFERPAVAGPGIHPTAVIAADAEIAATTSIGAQVVVGSGCRIGERSVIGPGCVLGDGCSVGDDCRLVARVTLVERVRVGNRVLIHPGAVLGADGFGIAMDQGRWLKVPQLGGVVVGDDCEIGANSAIDRGALSDTVLEEDVRIDNLVQVGHNVHIGAHTAIAGCAAIAGSARIGRYCLIGGGAGIVGHISLCDRVTITATSLVTHSIDAPGQYSSGTPLQESRQWRRNAVRLRQLDSLFRRVSAPSKDETPT